MSNRFLRARGAIFVVGLLTLTTNAFADTSTLDAPPAASVVRPETAVSNSEASASPETPPATNPQATDGPNGIDHKPSEPCTPTPEKKETPRIDPGATLRLYRTQELRLRISGGNVSVHRGRELEPLKLSSSNAAQFFAGSPRAIDEMRGYNAARSLGVLLYVVGFAALATDIALMIGGNELVVDNGEIQPAYWLFAAGGIGSLIIGDLQFSRARSKIQRAVEYYNEDLEAKILRETAARSYGVHLSGSF